MSSRPRRALVGLVVAAAAFAALPASALAAEGLSVTPANTQAGGLTDVSATQTFTSGLAPKTVVTSLAPGILGNLNANPSCLLSQSLTAGCQIGTASVATTASGTPFGGTLYLVPAAPSSGDVAGIEFVPASPPLTNQYIGVSPNPKAQGSLNLTTTFPNPAPAQITSFTASFTKLNGQEFTRLPSSCSPATSTMTVTYYGAMPGPSDSSSFSPTGCSSLAYAPVLTAAIARDKNDSGGSLTLGITQAATEAANKTIVLQLPSGLSPNVGADAPCLNSTGCTIGTATASSPLVPTVAFSNGSVKLTAVGTVPSITVTFPALGISLSGAVNLSNNSVTFSNVPDVPLTALTLNVTGPSGGKAFTTDCKPANVGGNFTAQSGATKTESAKITFTNCTFKPTVSGSTSGLASGHPKLKFKVVHGKGAPNIAAVALGVPGGLKFSRSAIVSHKTCTKASKGKKARCSVTTLIKGLKIVGGKAKSVAIKHGKLVITLKKPAGTVTITASGPLVSESKGLQTKVKKHKVKTLKFTVKVTDAKHHATTLSLKLRAH